eukprot:4124977-Amphidinium_carterae.1
MPTVQLLTRHVQSQSNVNATQTIGRCAFIDTWCLSKLSVRASESSSLPITSCTKAPHPPHTQLQQTATATQTLVRRVPHRLRASQ